jgi:hypothetical protein
MEAGVTMGAGVSVKADGKALGGDMGIGGKGMVVS